MEETIVYNSLARQLAPQIEAQLQTVVEPDLEIDVFNLGLIYAVDLTPEGHCHVKLTFTELTCDCQATVLPQLAAALTKVAVIKAVTTEIVYTPAWTMARITRNGRRFLGLAV